MNRFKYKLFYIQLIFLIKINFTNLIYWKLNFVLLTLLLFSTLKYVKGTLGLVW
jgi:hypothetical protein